MYNNPYLYQNLAKPGLFSKLFGGASSFRALGNGINWGNLLSNTQKSLGIINQAIPLVYQVKPIISNAKTMFRIAGALKDDNKNTTNNTTSTTSSNISSNSVNSTKALDDNRPIFYI